MSKSKYMTRAEADRFLDEFEAMIADGFERVLEKATDKAAAKELTDELMETFRRERAEAFPSE